MRCACAPHLAMPGAWPRARDPAAAGHPDRGHRRRRGYRRGGSRRGGALFDYLGKRSHRRPSEEPRVVLLEATHRLMDWLDPYFDSVARKTLSGLGVEVRLNTPVETASAEGLRRRRLVESGHQGLDGRREASPLVRDCQGSTMGLAARTWASTSRCRITPRSTCSVTPGSTPIRALVPCPPPPPSPCSRVRGLRATSNAAFAAQRASAAGRLSASSTGATS